MKVLFFIQCFPPLIKNAGGVTKRYFKLASSLIENGGHQVTVASPIDTMHNIDPNLKKHVDNGDLRFVDIEGMLIKFLDGSGLATNVFSFQTIKCLVNELYNTDLCIIDDIGFRFYVEMICTVFNVPTIITSHTDVTKLTSFKMPLVRFIYYIHTMFVNKTIHATVSNQFAKQIGTNYSWPPLIWSDDFKKPLDKSIIKKTRNEWLEKSFIKNKRKDFDGFALFCGRWSFEKRIDLLIKNTPTNILLVIVGNSLNEDAVLFVEKCGKEKDNVLLLKTMVDSNTLHTYYKSTDLYMSASNFETCGNTLIESWTCGTPVAVQPEQGHLEWLNDGGNGFAIDFDSKNCTEEILNAFKNKDNLPKLETTSKYFKTFDFYEEFYKNIIIPCLKIKKSKLRRILNLIVCVIMYFSVCFPSYLITNLLQYTYYKNTIKTKIWKYIEE